MIYIPVNTAFRESCEEFHKNSVPFDETDIDGDEDIVSFTKMHEACKKGNSKCEYILKVATYNYKEGVPLEKYFMAWYNEAITFRKLNRYQNKVWINLSPSLSDWWYVHRGSVVHFYLVMERFRGDLISLVGSRNITYKIAMERVECYLALIHYHCKVCLNNFKLEDILYKEIGYKNYRFVFSEFGSASKAVHREDIVKDRENFQDAYLLYK